MNIKIDRACNNIENELSYFAAYPIVGTIAGASKAFLGAFQAITALAVTILSIVPSIFAQDGSLVKYTISHIKHGVGNMMAGTLEAIPLFGTLLYLFRLAGKAHSSDVEVKVFSGHADKFMSYDSLVDEDWHIDGASDNEVKYFKRKLNDHINVHYLNQQLTRRQQYEIAQKLMGS